MRKLRSLGVQAGAPAPASVLGGCCPSADCCLGPLAPAAPELRCLWPWSAAFCCRSGAEEDGWAFPSWPRPSGCEARSSAAPPVSTVPGGIMRPPPCSTLLSAAVSWLLPPAIAATGASEPCPADFCARAGACQDASSCSAWTALRLAAARAELARSDSRWHINRCAPCRLPTGPSASSASVRLRLAASRSDLSFPDSGSLYCM